ncbi:P-loop containing nucleoside triphosphate hydrolase protein [Polychaeton citri CBS 116435]|uniref:P-loop containing nucleoside triphosphate hydrolase protein n=1 Tax=Polychaeton citri CBS 116435 TaxID=1314669 RepID=A0A9P4UST7_9PEZI|nr:P-loop containing nucleoside triphosphate hydrolase protein [Polychaeton citri CBS 116435]
MSEHKAIIVGISGVSSSGKTTLARLLRDIFPGTFILHEDDFYKVDKDIPVKDGVADWDCLEAINLKAFEDALSYIKSHGTSPPDFHSKEDNNSLGEVKVSSSVVSHLRDQARLVRNEQSLPVAIIDGFLLYSEEMKAIRDLFDVKIFLRTDYKTARSRREARTGYVTLEGFWEDPPGYVDKVVWPNYVKDHKFLFKDGNVEGELDQGVTSQLEIETMPADAQGDMTRCLQWAYSVLEGRLRSTME